MLTTPRDAWVERDGEQLASRTPVTLEGLPAGALQLTLGADGHQTAQVRAEVPKDGLGRLERVLQPIVYGTLTLELVPADAAVTLPDIGPSYRPGMRLPEGRYRVIASREGYVQATREVAIPGNGEAQERIELSPLPQPFTVAATPATARVRAGGRLRWLPCGDAAALGRVPGGGERCGASLQDRNGAAWRFGADGSPGRVGEAVGSGRPLPRLPGVPGDGCCAVGFVPDGFAGTPSRAGLTMRVPFIEWQLARRSLWVFTR